MPEMMTVSIKAPAGKGRTQPASIPRPRGTSGMSVRNPLPSRGPKKKGRASHHGDDETVTAAAKPNSLGSANRLKWASRTP
jgi:hypothetical protein